MWLTSGQKIVNANIWQLPGALLIGHDQYVIFPLHLFLSSAWHWDTTILRRVYDHKGQSNNMDETWLSYRSIDAAPEPFNSDFIYFIYTREITSPRWDIKKPLGQWYGQLERDWLPSDSPSKDKD